LGIAIIIGTIAAIETTAETGVQGPGDETTIITAIRIDRDREVQTTITIAITVSTIITTTITITINIAIAIAKIATITKT